MTVQEDGNIYYTIDNNYAEWSKLKNDIDSNKGNKFQQRERYNKKEAEGNKVIIEVNVSCDRAKSESDLLLLSYFFPTADGIITAYKIHSHMVINLADEINQDDSKDVSWKIVHYLCLQQLRETVSFGIRSRYKDIANFNDSAVINAALKAEFKNIYPIMAFTDKSASMFYYGKAFKTLKELKEPEQIEKTQRIQNNDTLDIIYAKLFYININKIKTGEIKGTQTNRITTKQKSVLSEELDKYINTMTMPVIAMYIWSILVRRMFAMKIMVYDADGDKHLIRERLEKAQYDAMSYAEGIYQLIENAIMHSSGKAGYLSIRLHNTNKDGAESELQSVANRIALLKKKYPVPNGFLPAKTYIEVTFVDNSFDYKDKTNKNMLDTSGGKFANLQELFERIPQNKKEVTLHYGLRVFEKNVLLNNGYFRVSTKGTDQYCRWVNERENERFHSQLISDKDLYAGTDYNILLPVYTEWRDETEEANGPADFMFETKNMDKEYKPYIIHVKIGELTNSNQDTKNKLIDDAEESIQKEFPNEENRIVCIYSENLVFQQVEILAKAVYRFAFDQDGLRLAIYFENKHFINEFVRIYSVFCDKVGKFYRDDKKHNDDIQIALCSFGSNDPSIPEVKFLLCSENLTTAKHTARAYTYYNSESSLEYVHTVQYLVRTKRDMQKQSGHKKNIPLFPFDLFLDIKDFNSTTLEEYNNSSPLCYDDIWFIRHINSVLETNIQEKGYGCKIGDIHISIGSKIHINSFYNAELLFHNYGNICRFAYLIARDIFKEYSVINHNYKDVPEKLCLIAYEEYSSLLIRQVKKILESKGIQVEMLIFSSAMDESETKDGKLWREFAEFAKKDVDHYRFHIILPIATTLTTIYKIYNIMGIIYSRMNTNKGALDFGQSIVMIVAGGINHNGSGGDGIEFGYWSKIDKEARVINIHDDNVNSSGMQRYVKYYFNPHCSWHRAVPDIDKSELGSDQNESELFSCSICSKDTKCLIGVDQTYTIPNVIFELFDNNRKEFEVIEERNDFRVNHLLGCVKYSHISNDQNHFQYSVDYARYCEKAEVQEELDTWLKELCSKIDANAFNIILSPLERSNSIFLDKVITKAFESNVRLLHIEIDKAFKESVRTKFSYITEEYNRIKSFRGSGKINVYFVDDCIVSGMTMQRGKQFMNMLLTENEKDFVNINIYKGIIVLANRSSYETIQNIMPGRVEQDFNAFMRLNVPSYNTLNGVCPACELAAQYDKMHKRASSPLIAEEYTGLYKKFTPKSPEYHSLWIERRVLELKSYEERFRQWLYVCCFESEKEHGEKQTLTYINTLGELAEKKTTLDMRKIFIALIEKGEYKGLRENLKELLKDDNSKVQELIRLVKEYVIAERDFMRMKTTHIAFEQLNTVMKGVKSREECNNKTRTQILRMITDQFKDLEDKFNYANKKLNDRECKVHSHSMYINKEILLRCKTEWLISFLKILSRKQVARYYHVRETMYSILIELADGILGITAAENVKTDLKFIVDMCTISETDTISTTITSDLKLRVLMIIIRRLSAMHSGYVIKNIESIYRYYDKCKQQYIGEKRYYRFYETAEKKEMYKKLFGFLSVKDFNISIAKLTKWSSMSGYDESKCFAIEQLFKQLQSNPEQAKDCPSEGLELSFLENSQIIYNGIGRILERQNSGQDIADHVERVYKNSYTQNEVKRFYPMSTHKLLFSFMSINGEKYNDIDNGWIELYANICSYYDCLKSMTYDERIKSPYKYERICNYMRDITEYDQCRIVCQDNGRVYTLVSSDIFKEYFDDDIISERIEEYVYNFENVLKGKGNKTARLINEVVQKYNIRSSEQKRELLIIKLPLEESKQLNLYIMLYKTISINDLVEELIDPDITDIWRVRNLLFMRDHLETVFARDIVMLQDMIHSYEFVSPINGDKTRILHISDMHIKGNNEAVKKLINNAKLQTPDLILITGDVIQGSYAATDLEGNYTAAAEVIRHLAKTVWATKDKKYIRSDWKKRIIISTGNHDYASMNELEAENELRTTASGKPSNTMGSTMIKYSYYIHFLHSLLNIDIDEAVKYDLNFFVDYEAMDITVVNINSNSRVNPYRTNKVGINGKAVNAMCNRRDYQKNIVFMMHHTPIYEIDYVSDAYLIADNVIWNQWSQKIKEMLGADPDELKPYVCWIDMLKAVSDDFNVEKNKQFYKGFSYYENVEKSKLEYLFVEMLKIAKSNYKGFESKKLTEFVIYTQIPEAERAYNDRCQRLRMSIKEKINTGKADSEQYNEFIRGFFEDLQRKTDHKYWILGGHTHRAAKFTGKAQKALKNCRGIIEAGKFYNNTRLSYVILDGSNTIIENVTMVPDEYESIDEQNNSTIRDIIE